MQISINWLKQFVDLPDSIHADEIARRLTLSTVEVEGVAEPGANLNEIVVGKVISAEKHPQADRLKVCLVSVGNENLQVVCGGSNVRDNMLVALAKVGAMVRWHGEGEPVKLKSTAIRGVESYGMICASTELGLEEMFPLKDEKEILDLTFTGAGPGTPLTEVLKMNDAVLEIDNKSLSNRPDLFGHYGLAREVAALFGKKLKDYKTKKISGDNDFKLNVSVADKNACPRYMAVALGGVKVEPSPQWLAQKLTAAGLRPINNIVDITNYVMLETGQPMHAFDAAKIADKTIIVRRAKIGEKFITLDEQKIILSDEDLVIADVDKPLALAGVIGGLGSGITDRTETIIFESANFEGFGIRRTALKYGLRTDSSMRFEKSLDPEQCRSALEKAVEMTAQLCRGAKVNSATADVYDGKKPEKTLEVPADYFSKILGAEFAPKEISGILQRLGFGVKHKKKFFSMVIPSWRATKDVSAPEDVAEEVLRVWGYEKIAGASPKFPITAPEVNQSRRLEHRLRDILSATLGYSEVYNYSFVSGRQIADLGDDPEKYLMLDNPVSKEKPYLRRTLLPNLLENLQANIENFPLVKIFEIGRVFRAEKNGPRIRGNSDELLPGQDNYLMAVCSLKGDDKPYWQARQAADTIFSSLSLPFEAVSPEEAGDKILLHEHPVRTALISCHGKTAGVVGEINPLMAEKLGLPARVGFVALNLETLGEIMKEHGSGAGYKPLPVFPEVVRDLSVVVKKEIANKKVLDVLAKLDPLLKSAELFDVYEGKNVGAGYKSLTYRLTYAQRDRTLTAVEVDKVQQKAIKFLADKFHAEVRQ